MPNTRLEDCTDKKYGYDDGYQNDNISGTE